MLFSSPIPDPILLGLLAKSGNLSAPDHWLVHFLVRSQWKGTFETEESEDARHHTTVSFSTAQFLRQAVRNIDAVVSGAAALGLVSNAMHCHLGENSKSLPYWCLLFVV